ncbi:hypothetical protein [Phenylobacterium sp.]|jgi:hypothetical protein|uniref:hypothetical protein n=1 Tax=Phenylobacterium sp. TaxID=1871053 RepID=UPI002F93F3D8
MSRTRQLLDQLIRQTCSTGGRKHPPLRLVTAAINAELEAAGLAPVGPRTVDRRMKAIYGRRWARRPEPSSQAAEPRAADT